MNYKFLLLILFLCSCASNNINRTKDTSDNINMIEDTSDNINKGNDVLLKYSNIKSESGTTNFDIGCPSKLFFEESVKKYSFSYYFRSLCLCQPFM